MNRRYFIKTAAAFVAGCALALGSRLQLPDEDEFDPLAYRGDWRWINIKPL